MAHFSRLDVLNTMIDTGLVPLYYKPQLEVAKKIVNACAEGGARVIEYTNRGDMAPFVFAELLQYATRELPNIILGAGTIIDPHTAALYMAYGANFIVGPNLNREVALLCNRRKIPYFPGCATPTEICEAETLGVEIVKLSHPHRLTDRSSSNLFWNPAPGHALCQREASRRPRIISPPGSEQASVV